MPWSGRGQGGRARRGRQRFWRPGARRRNRRARMSPRGRRNGAQLPKFFEFFLYFFPLLFQFF